jgi:amino acid transporter
VRPRVHLLVTGFKARTRRWSVGEEGETRTQVPPSARVGNQGRFRKVLSFRDLLFLSLGASIGSAWLFGSVYGASTAGPASIVSWLIGGVFTLLIAATWAELGGLLPSTGAVVKIPQYAHGYFAGFYIGWAYYLAAVIVPPVEAVAIVTYASAYAKSLTNDGFLTPEGYAVSISIILLTFALNSFGVKLFARFNTAITWWKLLIPAVTVVVALLYFYPPNLSSFGGFAPRGAGPIFSAVGTAGILFAYTGFRAAMDYSGEARNPRADVPRAMLWSVAVTIVLYTLLEAVFIGGIRWGASGLPAGDWAALSTAGVYASAPFYQLMIILGIGTMAALLLVTAVVSPLGTMGIYVGSSARDLFALAEGGHLSGTMNEVDRKYGVPRKALFVSLAVGIIFVFAFPNWGQLATVGTVATVFTFLAGSTSLVALRRDAPELKRSFRVPLVGVVAPLTFVMASLTVYWTTWPYTGYSVLAFIIGLALFFFARSRGHYPTSDIRRGLWIVAYSVLLALVSYLGSYGIGLIPFPYDFAVVSVLAVACYCWAVESYVPSQELKGLVEQEVVEASLE